MKHINRLIISGALIGGAFLGATLVAPDTFAQVTGAIDEASSADPTGGKEVSTIVVDVINILLYVIGILAVVMIIFAGIKYATANGAPDKIKSAKDTLVYSIVGLIVAVFAFAIVNFVLKAIGVV